MGWGTKFDRVSACLKICANQHSSNLLSAAYSHAHPYQMLCFQTRKYIASGGWALGYTGLKKTGPALEWARTWGGSSAFQLLKTGELEQDFGQ